jgi:hypothetical protein
MSKNRNRAKLNKATTSKHYQAILIAMLFPSYWDEGLRWQHPNIPNHKYRSYKTWKYNRKTKWK